VRLARSQRVARLGSWEWDADSGHVHKSDEIHAIAGVPPALFPRELPEILELVFPADRQRVRDAAASWLGTEGTHSAEFRLQRPDGAIRSVLCQVEGEFDEKGRAVRLHGIVQDVTDRKRAEERIYRLEHYDAVTDLPNRAWLLERLEQLIVRARRRDESIAVLFLDLDQFRRINDTLGHDAGDDLLRQVAGRMERSVRSEDFVSQFPARDANVGVARLGGDEFAVLIGAIHGAPDAAAVARRLLDSLCDAFEVGGLETFVTASVGIAVYPGDGEDGTALLKAADVAMYQAKSGGGNECQFYNRVLNANATQRLMLESELRRALEREEFVLHYQPQFDSATRQVVGVEALVRWNHPQRGLVMPGQFIAVAEECRLILGIDEWVLRTACRQSKAWQMSRSSAVPVSVNLSGHHFVLPSLVETVARALAESGLDPACLTLEVTEGVLMADNEVVNSNLRRLKDIGVRLSLDDFGTGYSSLSYLKRLPLDELKIDQSFVRDLVTDSDGAAIVSAIIAIARTLGLSLIAEGVESEGQSACLKLQGCNVMQGYLFCRPQPVETISALLGAERAEAPFGHGGARAIANLVR